MILDIESRLEKLEERILELENENHILRKENEQLRSENQKLKIENDQLKKKIGQLEKRLRLDSHNSHKPPSTSSFKKPIKSRRVKTGKPRGGQVGHPGFYLPPVSDPNEIITHRVLTCACCGEFLGDEPDSIQRHQVFDLPSIQFDITEHQVWVQKCSACDKENKGLCPEGITQLTQYGPVLKSWVAYMRTYQLIPVGRVAEFIFDLTGKKISTGTIDNIVQEFYSKLNGFDAYAKNQLLKSPVIHSDETGARAESALWWMHSCSNQRVTLFQFHPNRGSEAIEELGILPNYNGVVVHDRYRTYFLYSFTHALCNAHLIREMIYLDEEEGCTWASRLITLLVEAWEVKLKGELSDRLISRIEKKFLEIVINAIVELAESPDNSSKKKRGPKKLSKEHKLLLDMEKHHESVLRFLTNPDVPFDNNLAERDLRMVKLYQKISGCFRSYEGGLAFARSRSYISTLRKNEFSVWNGIKMAFENQPYYPNSG